MESGSRRGQCRHEWRPGLQVLQKGYSGRGGYNRRGVKMDIQRPLHNEQDATVCQMLTTMSVQIIVFCIVSIFSLSSLANFSKMKQSLVSMINENVKKLLMMLYRINADTLRFQYTWRGFLFTCPCRSWTWNKPKYVSNSWDQDQRKSQSLTSQSQIRPRFSEADASYDSLGIRTRERKDKRQGREGGGGISITIVSLLHLYTSSVRNMYLHPHSRADRTDLVTLFNSAYHSRELRIDLPNPPD